MISMIVRIAVVAAPIAVVVAPRTIPCIIIPRIIDPRIPVPGVPVP